MLLDYPPYVTLRALEFDLDVLTQTTTIKTMTAATITEAVAISAICHVFNPSSLSAIQGWNIFQWSG